MESLRINLFIFVMLSSVCGGCSFIIGEKELAVIDPSHSYPRETIDPLSSDSKTRVISQRKISRYAENQDYKSTNTESSRSESEEFHRHFGSVKFLEPRSKDHGQTLIMPSADKAFVVEARAKRSSDKSESRRRIPKGKQKKAKALGQLLMNSAADKYQDDPSDDYLEDDDDDDYSVGSKGPKMNWEDYLNEDGSSVLELIALNARHKTRMQRAHGDEYLYR